MKDRLRVGPERAMVQAMGLIVIAGVSFFVIPACTVGVVGDNQLTMATETASETELTEMMINSHLDDLYSKGYFRGLDPEFRVVSQPEVDSYCKSDNYAAACVREETGEVYVSRDARENRTYTGLLHTVSHELTHILLKSSETDLGWQEKELISGLASSMVTYEEVSNSLGGFIGADDFLDPYIVKYIPPEHHHYIIEVIEYFTHNDLIQEFLVAVSSGRREVIVRKIAEVYRGDLNLADVWMRAMADEIWKWYVLYGDYRMDD